MTKGNQRKNQDIDLTKTDDDAGMLPADNSEDYDSRQVVLEMQQSMRDILVYMTEDYIDFQASDAFSKLLKHVQNYGRILYSIVSNNVYSILSEDEKKAAGDQKKEGKFDTLLHNLDRLLAYANQESLIIKEWTESGVAVSVDEVKSGIRAVWKLWDHINLARRQYDVLKLSNSEYDEKFESRIASFKNKLTGELNSQLLTMVGIFTALAFVLFGGISSLENVLSGLQKAQLLVLLISGCAWGIGMINVMFVFLFCVGKMTRLNMISSDAKEATFWQKYPVVVWTDFILLSILVVLLWLYFCSNSGVLFLLQQQINKHPYIIMAVGTLIILIVMGCLWYRINKATKTLNEMEIHDG